MSIDEFWRWWDGARGAVAEAMDGGAGDAPVLHELMDRIDALGLGAETGVGLSARHAICVTPDGDPARRKLAYRWRDAAPPADEVFEYHPTRIAARQGVDYVLQIGGHDFSFADLRFALEVDEERNELDLEVQHPGFPQLDEDARVQVGFLALDSLLGEEEVERWVGELSFGADPPSATDGPAELRATVERLRITAGPEGTWSLFRGQMNGAPVTGLVTRPLRPVDHPYLDTVCELSAPVHDLSALQDNEEDLHAAFAGRALHAVSLTREGVRTAFVYVDQDTTAPADLKAWATERGYTVDIAYDPAWDAVRPFR